MVPKLIVMLAVLESLKSRPPGAATARVKVPVPFAVALDIPVTPMESARAAVSSDRRRVSPERIALRVRVWIVIAFS